MLFSGGSTGANSIIRAISAPLQHYHHWFLIICLQGRVFRLTIAISSITTATQETLVILVISVIIVIVAIAATVSSFICVICGCLGDLFA